jgi:hypothetical protein
LRIVLRKPVVLFPACFNKVYVLQWQHMSR